MNLLQIDAFIAISFVMLTNFLAVTYPPKTLFTTENATSTLHLYPGFSYCTVFLDDFAPFLPYYLTISTYTGVERIARNQGLRFRLAHPPSTSSRRCNLFSPRIDNSLNRFGLNH
jgi:hypothetical protein